MTTSPSNESPSASKHIPLLMIISLFVYASGVNKGFVFDDSFWIVNNTALDNPYVYTFESGNRPFPAATIALNYLLGGRNPIGYHLFNVMLHLWNVVLVYLCIRRVLRLPTFSERWQNHAASVAFAVSLLWAVHPLNTQAVTYVIQRAESLMAMMFLLALYCWILGSTAARRRWFWFISAIVCFHFSLFAKEVALVFPLVLVLLDYAYLSVRWHDPLTRRGWPYLILFACWGYWLKLTLAGAADAAGAKFGVGFGLKTTPMQYLLTETEVLWLYIKLSLVPVGQSGDYFGWKMASTLSDVSLAAFTMGALALITAIGMLIRPKLAFLGCWAFGILGPTSSIMPIQDVAFEHRMYLPLISVLALVVVGAFALLDRWQPRPWISRAVLAIVAATLGLLTIQRNEVYRNSFTFFHDAYTKRPQCLRAMAKNTESLILSGQYEKSEEALNYIMQNGYSNGYTLLLRATLSIEQGDYPRGMKVFRALLDDPSPNASQYWGDPYLRLIVGTKSWQESDEYLKRLRESAPERAETHAAAALFALVRNDRENARGSWGLAMQKDSKLKTRWLNEARRLALSQHPPRSRAYRLEIAYHLVHTICELEDTVSPEAWDTLAMVSSLTGRRAEAIAAAERGIQVAEARQDQRWKEAFTNRLTLYRAGKSYGPVE